MTPNQVIKHYGSKREAAYWLGFTEQAVQYWINKNRVPKRTQKLIEQMTGGRLKAQER